MTPRPPSDDSTKNNGDGPKKTGAKKATAEKKAAAAAGKSTAGKKKAVAKKAATGAQKATAALKKAAAERTGAAAAPAKKATAKKAAAKKASAEKATPARTTAGTAAAAPIAAARTAESAPVKKAAAKKAGARKAADTRTSASRGSAGGPAGPASPVGTRTARPATVPMARAAVEQDTPAAPVAGADPVPTGVAGQDVVLSPAVGAQDRERLLAGTHHDPHGVLGAHRVPGGVAFRTFRPYALSVTVVTDSLRAGLHDDGDGFFSGLLPLRDVPSYRLLVEYEGSVQDTADAYALLPTLGEFDLHLLGEGRHEELWRVLGSHPMTHQGVTGTRFSVWAPNARGVRVSGDFNFWDGAAFPMRSLGSSGVWELFVPGVGEGALYKYDITRPDGSRTLRADPLARRTEIPPNTSSIVHASHHEWGDGEWLAHRADTAVHRAPFSVYEVHLPSWRPGLTYRQLAEQLPAYVKELGFTHVELMPVAEHPFGGSWGYQVTGFYAPTARLGGPDDFKYLVDALHRA
ncbi:hypothetical protein ABZ870_45480, partial [Streptomyces sp. NPDC046978]